MAQYRLSHSADQDFFDIYIYVAQTFGVKQAEAYTAGMQVRFQEIADTPVYIRQSTASGRDIAVVFTAFMQFITVKRDNSYEKH